MSNRDDLRRQAAFQRAKREAAAALDDATPRRVAALKAYLFAEQLAFILDPFRFKSLLCPRRSGKTETIAVYMLLTALEKKRSSSVYITITIGVAKRNIWRTLKRLNDDFSLGATFNNSDLTMTLGSSIITLGGAETMADIDKYRGSPHDLIVLDESKSFPSDLIDELVEDVLTPCLGDRLGTLVMAGTPGSILAGSFYEATREEASIIVTDEQRGKRHAVTRPWRLAKLPQWQGVAFKWSHHNWTTRDNVKMPHLWQTQLADKERNGWTDDHPTWVREFLGRWVPSVDGMVFRFDKERDTWKADGKGPHGLPEEHDWHYVIGIDLGYDDDTAFVVFAWSETCPILYQVDEYAAPYMLPPDIAAKYKELEGKYGSFVAGVGDRGGLGKTILATLEHEYGICIDPADKTEKRDHVELMNGDLVAGQIKVLAESKLALQMSICQWDETGKKFDKDLPDHCVDAAIYTWRYCYHHFAKARTKPVEKGSPAWLALLAEQEFQRTRARRLRREEMDDWEKDEDDLKLDFIDESIEHMELDA
jgi:hypothetical protein